MGLGHRTHLNQIADAVVLKVFLRSGELPGGHFIEHDRRNDEFVIQLSDEIVPLIELLQRDQRSSIAHNLPYGSPQACSSTSMVSGVSARTENPNRGSNSSKARREILSTRHASFSESFPTW